MFTPHPEAKRNGTQGIQYYTACPKNFMKIMYSISRKCKFLLVGLVSYPKFWLRLATDHTIVQYPLYVHFGNKNVIYFICKFLVWGSFPLAIAKLRSFSRKISFLRFNQFYFPSEATDRPGFSVLDQSLEGESPQSFWSVQNLI